MVDPLDEAGEVAAAVAVGVARTSRRRGSRPPRSSTRGRSSGRCAWRARTRPGPEHSVDATSSASADAPRRALPSGTHRVVARGTPRRRTAHRTSVPSKRCAETCTESAWPARSRRARRLSVRRRRARGRTPARSARGTAAPAGAAHRHDRPRGQRPQAQRPQDRDAAAARPRRRHAGRVGEAQFVQAPGGFALTIRPGAAGRDEAREPRRRVVGGDPVGPRRHAGPDHAAVLRGAPLRGIGDDLLVEVDRRRQRRQRGRGRSGDAVGAVGDEPREAEVADVPRAEVETIAHRCGSPAASSGTPRSAASAR